jgi:hypothetical protein
MKLLKTGILALSLTVTATVGLAANYEIFPGATTVGAGENHYAIERLDHKNKKHYHCDVLRDAMTKQLTGQCTERPDFPKNRDGNGPNVLGEMSNIFGGLPVVVGYWKIGPITGTTEFCIPDDAQCVDVTPQP